MATPHIAVIGAGISGAACAHTLAAAGCRVTVFEKSRGSGGRLASKRLADGSANIGGQDFSARTPEFRQQLRHWQERGLLLRRGDIWWPQGKTSQLTRDLLVGTELLTQVAIAGVVATPTGVTLRAGDGNTFTDLAAVAISVPAPQAVSLLAEFPALRSQCEPVRMTPAWVAVFASDHLWSSGAQPLPPAVASVVQREGHDGRYQWVVEAAAAWSAAELEREPRWVGTYLRDALLAIGAVPASAIELLHCHRWRYARAHTTLNQAYLWQAPIGVCGDWLHGDDVEAAYCSGRALAAAILSSLANL